MRNRMLIAAAVLVAGVAGYAGHARGDDREKGPRGRSLDAAAAFQEMGLTEAQADGVRSIVEGGRKAAVQRRADMRKARIELRDAIAAPTVDDKEVAEKVRQLSDVAAKEVRARAEEALAVRRLVSPEQFRKLEKLRMERLAGPPGPRAEGRHRGHAKDDEDRDDDAPVPELH